jgi:hypothetical protein
MELRIRPEPTAMERKAIERALTRASSRDGGGRASRWREEGVRENTAGDPPSALETLPGGGRRF